MLDLYVYYKVREIDASTLAPQVAALQREVAARHGVHGQLKRRPGAREGLQTWMEVYPAVDESFAALLAEAVAQAGLQDRLAGPRHAEAFIDLPVDLGQGDAPPCA